MDLLFYGQEKDDNAPRRSLLRRLEVRRSTVKMAPLPNVAMLLSGGANEGDARVEPRGGIQRRKVIKIDGQELDSSGFHDWFKERKERVEVEAAFAHFAGITSNDAGEVIELDLSDRQLTELPEGIGKLTKLEKVSCCSNKLTGEFPRIFSASANQYAVLTE